MSKEKAKQYLTGTLSPEESEEYGYYHETNSDGYMKSTSLSDLSLAQAKYEFDTHKELNEMKSKEFDQNVVSDSIKYLSRELWHISNNVYELAHKQLNLNLDGSYPNKDSLDKRIKKVVDKEIVKYHADKDGYLVPNTKGATPPNLKLKSVAKAKSSTTAKSKKK